MKKIKVIALFLAIVMLITFTPISVMKAMADGVEKSVWISKVQQRKFPRRPNLP